ncbi:MAG TPA: hypothetical protein VK752_25505 [Bryobacteraceae bacterium]|jgi:hypothetical protein|nr:hypothetical protein [Bryobacteraceae bacterium]
MDFSRLISIARWEVNLFVYGLAAIVALKLLTGQINTRYLLHGMRRDGTRYFSPERVQMLLATIIVALQYLLLVRHAAPGQMPELPNGSLQLLGLSHVIYLGGKGFTAFREKN